MALYTVASANKPLSPELLTLDTFARLKFASYVTALNQGGGEIGEPLVTAHLLSTVQAMEARSGNFSFAASPHHPGYL